MGSNVWSSARGSIFPALEPGEVVEQETNELAEKILTLPVMKHGGSRAYYSRSGDFIAMPVRETFENLDFYFSVVYHEITHWSGSKAWLARTFGKRFGDNDYAFEELVAETAAANARFSNENILINEPIIIRADEIAKMGLDAFDALHLACAEMPGWMSF